LYIQCYEISSTDSVIKWWGTDRVTKWGYRQGYKVEGTDRVIKWGYYVTKGGKDWVTK
jgi:hypothetical protein